MGAVFDGMRNVLSASGARRQRPGKGWRLEGAGGPF